MKKLLTILTLILSLFSIQESLGQDNLSKQWRLGFNTGFGNEDVIPFQNKDYSYKTQFYKAQINYTLKDKEKISLELNFEPSIYISEHQLLNPFFVTPDRPQEEKDQLPEFLKRKTINEYVLNCGFIFRYKPIDHLSTYALLSVGPMISDTETERLSKGFAFSDIFGIGLGYNINNNLFLDLRGSFRHVSNANLTDNNSGHNSTNIELGFAFLL